MEIDFKQVLEENKNQVWPEIKSYLDKLLDLPPYCAIPAKYNNLKKFHSKIVKDYPQRQGKYFRPSLVLLTAQGMGYPIKKTLKTAAAMQISEDWILIHDDIEDDSLERRGQPALHQIYGKELSINAGDALHILMWQALMDNLNIVGDSLGKKVYDEFCTMLSRTVFGQTVEIKWTQDNKQNMTNQDILLILESKTAYYTIAGPMRLGAILAGATKKQLDSIYAFAKPLGFCFQIRDDLLDLTSNFEGQKKQTGNDIYEGKRTIMLVHLLKNANQKDKKSLVNILNKNRQNKTRKEVGWVIEMMKKYGSLDYGEKLATKFAHQAKEIFDRDLNFLSKQPARDQPLSGIDFVLNRKH
jgi:geranylgeranyl diphosphate synthase type II